MVSLNVRVALQRSLEKTGNKAMCGCGRRSIGLSRRTSFSGEVGSLAKADRSLIAKLKLPVGLGQSGLAWSLGITGLCFSHPRCAGSVRFRRPRSLRCMHEGRKQNGGQYSSLQSQSESHRYETLSPSTFWAVVPKILNVYDLNHAVVTSSRAEPRTKKLQNQELD